MGWPLPEQYGITTAYGKRGPSWSCKKDSNGNGVHTGADFACPVNTPLYATIAGQIRHRDYGPAFGSRQFAISPDSDQPYSEGEVFYAHGNERLPDGTYVKVGDYVGKSGARGNVSGPHLHYEYHPKTKDTWDCSVVADPSPTLEPPSPITGVDNVKLKKWYSGKPSGAFTVPSDGKWHKLDLDEPDLGIKTDSSDHRFLYLRIELDGTRSVDKVLETKFIRTGGDDTAYDSETFGLTLNSYPYRNFHMEDGPGKGGKWYVKVTGGTSSVKITTRYAKIHVFFEG